MAMVELVRSWRSGWFPLMLAAAVTPAVARAGTVDAGAAMAVRTVVEADRQEASRPSAQEQRVDPGDQGTDAAAAPVATPVGTSGTAREAPSASGAEAQASAASANATYQEGDLIDAAEGVFGKGAEGLAKIIERILKDQGRPVAYIAGREAGGAFVAGVRYGSGEMFHKVEGKRAVFWTGPSIGFDVGASGAKTFVLVYNLFDTQDLFRRYPAIEGQAYFIGGFNASYLRRGQVVLIPIRLGVGWRLGANIGYMRFSEKSRLLPF